MKRRITQALAGLVLLSVAMSSCSDDGALVVEEPWARPTAPSAANAAFYGVVQNDSGVSDRISAMSSPQCAAIELHRSSMSDGVMSMHPADPGDFEVPSGTSITLEPGGLHFMCMGLQEPLVQGQHAELALTFVNGGSLVVEVPVDNR